MKYIIAFIILLATSTAMAADVKLAWDAVTPAPDGYRLYMRQGDSGYDYDLPIRTLTATTDTITGLENDITYAFVVRAYIGDDESVDSNEVQFTPTAPAEDVAYPGAPINIAWNGDMITWAAGGGAVPTGYRVYVNGAMAAEIPAPAYSTSELIPGTEYTVYVRSIVAALEGPPSQSVIFAMPSDLPAVVYPRQIKELRINFD